MIIDISKEILRLCALNDANLCLATKTQPIGNIQLANISPKIILAENRVQEAEEKLHYYQSVCNPLHLIGPLQKNKVRKAVRIFDCIQSVDSLELLRRIDRIAAEEEKNIEIFLNINISEDPHKTGFILTEIISVIENIKNTPLQSTTITGIFTILEQGLPDNDTAKYYTSMKRLFDMLTKVFGQKFVHLSMGMSNDYKIALSQGSTMVRIGSSIFGQRP